MILSAMLRRKFCLPFVSSTQKPIYHPSRLTSPLARTMWQKYFAVGSSDGIDGARPAHLRHLTSNSTPWAGQHFIRSLAVLVNRLLNADFSDHARKPLIFGNLTRRRRTRRTEESDPLLLVMFSAILPQRLVVQP